MEVEFYLPKQFENLKSDWERLQKGSEMTAYQSFEWHASLNKLYGSEKVKNKVRIWFYAVVKKKDKVVMIAPLQYYKVTIGGKGVGIKKGFYFIGRMGFTDYMNFIYDEFKSEYVEAIITAIVKRYKVKFFCLEQLPKASSLAEYINRQTRDGVCFEYSFDYGMVDDITAQSIVEIKKSRAKRLNQSARKQMSIKGRIYSSLANPITRIFSKKHSVLTEKVNAWCFKVTKGDDLAGFFWGITDDSKQKMYVIFAGVKEEYSWYSPTIS